MFNAKLMETKFYTCQYCFKEFEPKRRRVQKYCSTTCRVKSHHAKKTSNKSPVAVPSIKDKIKVPVSPKLSKVESMSVAGTANAAAGSLLADGVKNIMTPLHSKNATKGDLENLRKQLISRYHRISNLAPRSDGAKPYFDMNTGEVVYSFFNL